MRIEIFQDGSVAIDGKIQELVLDFQGEEVDLNKAIISRERYGDRNPGEYTMLVIDANVLS